jgi:hypothetical protein
MPLISRGSLDGFTAVASDSRTLDQGLTGPHAFSVFREVARELQPVPLTFSQSGSPIQLHITGVRLNPGSRVMLRHVADADRPVYLLVWWWDLAGGGPVVVPLLPNAADWVLTLGGDGRHLARPLTVVEPGREIVGGLAVRVILWQSEPGTDAGRVTAEVAEAMRHSMLAGMLGILASASGTDMATVIAIRQAAAALGPEIAPVLRALCPDYIDFFEGFYPATDPVQDGESYVGYQSEITVRTTVEYRAVPWASGL